MSSTTRLDLPAGQVVKPCTPDWELLDDARREQRLGPVLAVGAGTMALLAGAALLLSRRLFPHERGWQRERTARPGYERRLSATALAAVPAPGCRARLVWPQSLPFHVVHDAGDGRGVSP